MVAEDMGVLEQVTTAGEAVVTPFLRWAGGKRWLVPKLLELLGHEDIKRYHEPFLGGGAVFFALTVTHEAFLSDLNTDLIEVFRQVRDNPTGVAERLAKFENTETEYYEARTTVPTESIERAARFIFLNHTSYNGIFRVNLQGEYNVPFGYRKFMNMPDEDWLTQASNRLQGVELNSGDFERALGEVKEGDLVFLDPPYTVSHNNNGFVKYNQHLFSFDDQKRLAGAIKQIGDLGARFILTNAAHSSIEELFSPLGRRIKVSRRNSIGGKQAVRGNIDEFVFTNIEAT